MPCSLIRRAASWATRARWRCVRSCAWILWCSPRAMTHPRVVCMCTSEDVVGVVLLFLLLFLRCLFAKTVNVLDLHDFTHAAWRRQARAWVDLHRGDAWRHGQRVQRLVFQDRAHVVHPDRQRRLGAELAATE